MEEKVVRRSKIYTYFYGRNTVFQKFLILVGALFILLSGIAEAANRELYYEKRRNALESYNYFRDAYNDILYEYIGDFDVSRGEKAKIEDNDPLETEKTKYNEALEKYKKAEEKYEKLTENGPTKGFFGVLSILIGIAGVAIGLGWLVYKKWSFNAVGEAEYDAELADRIEAAKVKGMEKLNIVAEQIDSVEPVVLDGVADADYMNVNDPSGLLKKLLGGILKAILSLDNIILGAIAIAIYTAFLSGSPMGTFVFFFLLTLGGMGYYGYYLYNKYEKDSFVREKVFDKLEKFAPALKTKLGSDDQVRVSLPAITVYMFGQEQLYVYYQYLDIVTGEIFVEGVHEYFYEDIVGITSSQKVMKMLVRHGFLKLFLRSVRYLKESITVATSGGSHDETYFVDMGQSLLDTKFTGMRNLIRQKKNEQ